MSEPTRKSADATRQRDQIPHPLAALRDDFERQIESMQTPANKEAADALFEATGAEIGALAAARARESARIDAASQSELSEKARPRTSSIAQLSRKLSAQSLAANRSMEASRKDGLDSPATKRPVRKRQID